MLSMVISPLGGQEGRRAGGHLSCNALLAPACVPHHQRLHALLLMLLAARRPLLRARPPPTWMTTLLRSAG